MDSTPDHVLLAIFKHSPIRDRMLSFQFVCDRWRHLCLYNLAQDIGPGLDVAAFEALSAVGVRNRNDKMARFEETSAFLSRLLHFLLIDISYEPKSNSRSEFRSIRFSAGRSSPNNNNKYPEWIIDESVMDLLYARCPNLETLDFDNASVETEALAKLTLFENLKHLVIKRVGAEFAPILLQQHGDLPSRLESLRISGKDAPLPSPATPFGNLRELVIDAPTPTSYATDLLTNLIASAPSLERLIRLRGGGGSFDDRREQLPGDVIAQLRTHPGLNTFSDRMFYVNDDAALTQLLQQQQQPGGGGSGPDDQTTPAPARARFRNLGIYTEDCVRLSPLVQLENLRSVSVDGRNLEPDELASIFLLPGLERVSLSWTFKDDPSCVLESQSEYSGKMMDIRCGNLQTAHLHLDYLSANGRAWGKNVIVNLLQQCPRLRRLTNSDWLLSTDYVELRRAEERFVQVVRSIDLNVNSAEEVFEILHEIVASSADDVSAAAEAPAAADLLEFTANPFPWPALTALTLFINEDYYVCDLSCVNGDTLPNLRTFRVRSDSEVMFREFCQPTTLPRLRRIEGAVRFEAAGAEADWLDAIGEHRRLVWLSTLYTNLPPSLFCDVLMRARARCREAGYLAPVTVIYVTPASARKIRITDNERHRWAEVTKILYTGAGIVLRLVCA